MKIVSYNIHYAIGNDDRYDLDRIIDSVKTADLIALQEVERHYGMPDGPNQPEDIANRLPEYYWIFDAAFDLDGSEQRVDGSIMNRRRQHGQMLLSRWPIITKRYFPLPRINPGKEFNMQMGALEALIDSPLGVVRIYIVHLGSVSGQERQSQIRFLLDLIKQVPSQGGAWTGDADHHVDRDWSTGLAEPVMPQTAILIGDFNMSQQSPEYGMVVQAMTDIWLSHNPGEKVLTWHPNSSRSGDEVADRLDYCFLTADLVDRVQSSWVDEVADGSDHQPLWVEFQTR